MEIFYIYLPQVIPQPLGEIEQPLQEGDEGLGPSDELFPVLNEVVSPGPDGLKLGTDPDKTKSYEFFFRN